MFLIDRTVNNSQPGILRDLQFMVESEPLSCISKPYLQCWFKSGPKYFTSKPDQKRQERFTGFKTCALTRKCEITAGYQLITESSEGKAGSQSLAMWPCTCACVWTLACVSVVSGLDYDDSFETFSGYSEDYPGNVSEHWDTLVKLLGNSTNLKLLEDESSKNVSTETLKGLSDSEIWSAMINDEGSEVMMNDEAPTLDQDFSQESNESLNSQKLEATDKFAQEKVLDGLLEDPDVQSDSAGPKDAKGSSTLAFVFDTTGSMWDDLVQVRHGAAKIMQTMLERPDKPIADYVLVPFHDPLIGPVTVTTDHKLLMQRLNEIQIYGGGDCPEASVEAVLQALQLSRPNSYIYVFTDARAKDHHLINQVLPLIQKKQSQVVFVMTGDCGDQTHPGYQVYHKIAATSSGQVYHLNKTDVDEVLSFVRVSLQSRKVNLLSVERPPAQRPADLPLPIDQSLKEFTVSVSGSNASIGVVDPGGHMVHSPQLTPLLDLQNVKVVNVKEPPPGMWTLQVGSDSQHTVRSTGLSGSDFVHGFSVIPTTNMAETYHRPLKSGYNSVLIRATEPDALYNLTTLELVLLNGTVVQTIPLCVVEHQPGLYSGGPFIPPNEFFYLGVHGFGKDNFPVKRITATAISAQPPELPTVTITTSYVAQIGKPLTLSCRVESLVPFVVRWYKDGAIKTKAMTYNQTAEVPLQIDSVKKTDAGRYICKVHIPNIPGTVFKDTRVQVTGPPPLVVTPKEVSARPGAPMELTCSVTSEMSYNVSWYRLSTRAKDTSGKAVLDQLTGSPGVVISANNSLVLTSPDIPDEGWYICTAQNTGGQSSGRVYLSIQQPPAVRVTPAHHQYTVGSSVHLHCQVLAGIPYPSVTWTKDNIPVQGDDEPNDNIQWTLRLRNLQKEDEGTYLCEAKNSVGSAQGSAELTLLEPPEVRAETGSQLVKLGDSVSLRCSASGAPTPQITWYRDQTLLTDDSHPKIQILNNGGLEIYNTSPEDSGRYTCVARNKVGTAKDFVDVEIGSGPRVVHLPSDLAVPIGGSASVLCAAIGNPVPQTTWSRDGRPLQSPRMFTSEQGELFIREAEKDDEGNYTCTVENTFGKATYSVNVKITGIVSPRLMPGSLPRSTKVLNGRSVQLLCPVLAGNPPPTRQWFKDGALLDNYYSYLKIGNDGSLLLANVSSVHKGSYECVVSNVGGRDSFTTTVDVMVPPNIIVTEQDKRRSAVEGSDVTFACPVTGDPTPNVTWSRHFKRLPTSGPNNSSLVLRNVSFSDYGPYTCMAMSPAGSTSISVFLNVLIPPRFDVLKENITVNEGHIARLECYFLSNPRSNISWYFETKLLPYYDLVVTFPVNRTSAGQYKCLAENEVGSSAKLINLFVTVVPRIDPLTPTKVVGVAGEDVQLSCPATGQPKPSISWSKQGSPLPRQVSADGSVMLANLTTADAGTYVCTTTNMAGSAVLPIALDVHVKPVIVRWEGEASVLEGEVVNVVCEAEGDPVPSFKWLSNGETHTVGSTLKFMVKRENAGIYVCVAENKVGSDRQNFSLTVIVPAQIVGSEQEAVRLYGNGSDTRLICEVDGVPWPSVTWYKDGVNVTNDKRFRIEGNALVVSNASDDLAGTYICQAENVAGIAQKIFETEFYEPPRILDTSPTLITLREGDDYTIPCTATGVPTPDVRWRGLAPGFQNDEIVVMKDNLLVLTQVTIASEGEYQCVASSAAGVAQRNYTVHVVVPPVAMNSSVTRVEIVESNSGILTCPVQHGLPHPSIQWLKDGVPISFVVNERADDTHYILKDGSLSLKIVEARPEDSGLYACIATNLAGRSQAEFDVKILAHPHFLDEFPETEFVKTEGERLELNCSVGGNPEPKISWKRVEQNLPVSQHTSPGVMLELPHRWRLVIPSVRPHHSGTYQCTATNQLGRNTRTFSLRVTAPPELDGPKEESIDVSRGDRLSLQCRVWGTPAPSISWEYEETDASNFQKIESEGVDPRILEVSAQSGLYRCNASNSLGSVSKLFNVTISEPPMIARSDLTEELRVKLGGDLVLPCEVTGQPTPSVTWLHNGHVLPDGHSLGHTLVLGPVTTRSGGKYACVASNKAGIAEKTFKVKVLVPPRISETYQFSADPQVAVVEGLPLTLRCPVTGTPPPAIAWVKDGAPQDGGEMFTVAAATSHDAGNYTCTATNHVGNVSKSFIVVVHSAPKFLDEETSPQIELLSKSTLRLNCSVSANPPPSIMWLRGSNHVNSSVVNLSRDNQTLTVDSVGLDDSGQYSCIASNIAGAMEKTFSVNVLEAPSVMGDEAAGNTSSPPSPLRVMLHRKIVLECLVSGTPQPNITWYKDGELLSGYQTSTDGRNLHIMNAVTRHGGNYSCRAENQAGVTQLFLPVIVIVPLQWTDWTAWTVCSKSCGGGKESRERQCGHNTNTSSAFVEFDLSECVGDKIQSRPCNVLPCQVHGGWSEWTDWTSCSESCGRGTRRRYRRCDSPAPALGGDTCLGSDGEQETCTIQPCPQQSQWSEWTSWSECTAKCGVGTKFRARQCVRGEEVADDCEGPKQQVSNCSNRKCPVDGKWTTWSPWSSCSVTCGRGLRQRHRLCSRRLYGGKPCFGDNIQIEKCVMEECEAPLDVGKTAAQKSASLRIRGEVNGRRVEDMYLDAQIQQDGPKRRVTATVKDILKAQASWFPYLTFLMPPLSWNPASGRGKPHGQAFNSGNFTEESRFQFATGQELMVKHIGKGVDKKGALKVDIEVVGEVPLLQPTSSVMVDPYSEDYVKTALNAVYTAASSALDVDGEKVPFHWNRTVLFDASRDTVPYLVERLSTDEVASKYNPENDQFDFEVSSEMSKKYRNNNCPVGFKLDPQYHHCTDIDECKEIKKTCHSNQVCENQFGSYQCVCQSGFRLSPNRAKCVDINECLEGKPCSHMCHNTRGSFYCSCPPQLALSHSGLTCKAWGELDMEEPDDDYVEEDMDSNYQFLEAPVETSVSCKPGLVWRNDDCVDVDECIRDDACKEEETCMNTPGSFHCLKTPCPDSYWDHFTRSCIRVCEEWRGGCAGNAVVAEFVRYIPLTLSSAMLQPYQELAILQPLGLHDELLTHSVFDITDNEQDVPLRIRIEDGQGILYVMKYFDISGIYRLTVKASSFSKDYKTELYTTDFVVFLYAESKDIDN
ncbi:hemicentin-1-like [Macrosteles quadrilineatus]|uniref:hemicentin-1-like n=1 Tax=Macrosteles quadrilineatus TaxID=74068 RepID=UPI0023E2CEB0|nr:hemicentin-1-like [Macrosteles quadrilineatus]